MTASTKVWDVFVLFLFFLHYRHTCFEMILALWHCYFTNVLEWQHDFCLIIKADKTCIFSHWFLSWISMHVSSSYYWSFKIEVIYLKFKTWIDIWKIKVMESKNTKIKEYQMLANYICLLKFVQHSGDNCGWNLIFVMIYIMFT